MITRRTITLACLMILAAARSVCADPEPLPSPPPAAAFPGKLRWNNGETLPGQAIEASSTELAWSTPLFEEPLRLSWGSLNRIDQPLAAKAAPDAFSFILRDGSFLYGDLVAATETEFTIHSSRHGEVALKRAEVSGIHRLHDGGSLWVGPSGDVGWYAVADGKNLPDPKKPPGTPPAIPTVLGTAGGALSLPYFNRGAFLPLPLPTAVDVEFHVRASSARPDFQLALNTDSKQGCLRIETWNDQLVLAMGDQFQFIRKVAESDREVALRVCWDGASRHCSVFTPTGEPLAEWQIPVDASSARPGLVLQNKGRDLALEFLRVRAWDGKPPPTFTARQARIELKDGRITNGQIVGASSTGGVIFRAASGQENAEMNFPLADLESIDLPTDAPKATEPEATLSFADGTFLRGEISEIKGGLALLNTTFTAAALATNLHDTRQVRLKAPGKPERPLDEMDKIVLGQTTLHGQIVCTGSDSPRWRPMGGTQLATPLTVLPCEIDRAVLPGTKFTPAPALFFTAGGDVLPGQLHALDRSGVELESGVVEVTKLPAADLDAIQFGAAAQADLSDFNDASWQVLKGDAKTVHRDGGTLKMEADTSIGNPLAMQGKELSFSLEPGGYSTTRLRMFCAGVDPKKSVSLMLMMTGYQVISGLESSEGQLEEQTRTHIATGPVQVRLVIADKAVDLYFNGVWAQQYPVEFSKRAGSGLVIEPSSLWGNGVQPITLSHLSVSSAPGQLNYADVNAEAKAQALTIPRFHKEDPPRHALVAMNGDVLRGEIEGITVSHLGFRTGLENLNVPRDRVKAAIWLKQPSESAAPPEKSVEDKTLEQKIGRRTRYQNAELNTLINFIKQEAPGLTFKLPETEDKRRVDMQFNGQTIAAALEKICSMFALTYRLENEGVVVLTPAPKDNGKDAGKDMVTKVYWLKSPAFPDADAVQTVLTARGIPFPKGSSAQWQPGARQLMVINTTANQRQLSDLLENDFGGITGSPTYWLVLGNGAKVGLVIDRFDADFVVGHHPVYGLCRVPVQDIYAIRTSPPPLSAAIKTLRDWKLAFAPEPVLPEAGGESSPLLGKEAKGFKLALLDGGDFDLATEKGRVVVLDFWATWCGPCIKSLPGLIDALAAFPPDRVKLVGLNQGEPNEQVKRFLETRGWKLTVAMDVGQNVARQYGVDAIPHTIIVGPDGKVAWVKTGYNPDGDSEVTEAVKKLLGPASSSELTAKQIAP